MAVQLPEGMGADEVRAAVRDRHGQVAAAPDAGYNFPAGRAFAEAVGYPIALLDGRPPDAAEASAGVGCPAGWTAGARDRAGLRAGDGRAGDAGNRGGHEAERLR